NHKVNNCQVGSRKTRAPLDSSGASRNRGSSATLTYSYMSILSAVWLGRALLQTHSTRSENRLAVIPLEPVLNADSGGFTELRLPPTASASCFHAEGDGHAASAGRRVRRGAAADRRAGHIGRRAADPRALRNALLSMCETHAGHGSFDSTPQ